MRAVDLIVKKRDGQELNQKEIDYLIRGFTKGEIPDYQVTAWAMAVHFQGMTPLETSALTNAMVESGEKLNLSSIVSVAVDKHSTGGVGDKTTLVVQPVVAACGVPIGKMSGKGLAFTGGTLDKMESIPGYRIDLSTKEFLNQLKEIGLVLTGQTLDLAPADGKLYALRDVTGTVPPIPLIAASIMSKKIAAGAQATVLDVKVGLGAFMQEEQKAVELARMMVRIGAIAGQEVVALITDMNQPLGFAVGNALEVIEAIDTLKGKGPRDFREHCLEVAGHLLILAGHAQDLYEAKSFSEKVLEDGSAFEKFRLLVETQEGDVAFVDDPNLFPKASVIKEVLSPESGYIRQIHAREIGLAAMALGAGRGRKSDKIDHAVGIVLNHKVGDQIESGDRLFTIHANDEWKCATAINRVLAAHAFSESPVDPLPLVYQKIMEERGENIK